MLQKLSALLVVTTALTPIALNAEQNFFKDKLPSIVENIAIDHRGMKCCVTASTHINALNVFWDVSPTIFINHRWLR